MLNKGKSLNARKYSEWKLGSGSTIPLVPKPTQCRSFEDAQTRRAICFGSVRQHLPLHTDIRDPTHQIECVALRVLTAVPISILSDALFQKVPLDSFSKRIAVAHHVANFTGLYALHKNLR